MKQDLSAIKKDQSLIKEQVKLQQQKTDALFNRVQELHGTLSKLHQADRKLQKQENYHNLHAISQSVAGNLVQVEMNLREEINKDLEKLYSLFEALHYQNLITHKELHNLSILHQSKRQKKGLDASQKADLKVAMQALRLSLGKSDQTIADDLNRDGIPTLTGQGEWTALKVKRFLGSK